MVKKFLKSKSKRVPAKKRYKIEKKVREHNRKIKKADKAKAKSQSRKPKIITVPGDCPFKETILLESIALRQKIQQRKQDHKDSVKANRKLRKETLVAQKRGLPTTTITAVVGVKQDAKANGTQSLLPSKDEAKKATSFEDLLKRAQDRGYQFEKIEEAKIKRDPSLKAFYKEFQQVIGDSDVIIQVLDSRDPIGTRSAEAEEAVRSQSDKKLILVLNKCDLVPIDNLQNWVAYLKQTAGCVVLPFKANTQKQKDRFGSVGTVNMSHQASMDTKKTIGISDLLGLLGTWARGTAGGLTVGVIGMPNVGKSSLINSLKRSKACNVGAKPGVTRACQLVHLDSKLRLVDSPGVIFSKDKGNEAMNIETILARVPRETLMNQYGIEEYGDEEQFLSLIAKKFGQMKKGGIPNPTAAEQKIIHDWNTGAIRFFTEPPELSSTTTSTAFVTDLAQPFTLDKFETTTLTPDAEMEDEDEDDVEMEAEEAKPAGRVTRSASRKSVSFAVNTEILGTKRQQKMKAAAAPVVGISPQEKSKLLHGLVATKKTLLKKLRKSKKKTSKQASSLADIMGGIKM